MKSVGILLLLLLSTSCFAQFAVKDIADLERKQYLNILRSDSAGALNNYNNIYQRLELQVNPAVDSIAGRVTTWFIPDSALSAIQFDLTDSLTVDSISWNGTWLNFSHSADVINAVFPATLADGYVDSVSVYYHGKPAVSGFGSFEQGKHGPDSVPIIWTLSEPYGAKDWWPCKQNLQDKIDSLDVLVTCPSQYRAASNGLLVEEIPSGNNVTYHWRHRYPIATYLVCMAVTNYFVYNDQVVFKGDTLPVVNYLYPESLANDTVQCKLAIPCMQLYDSLFGFYPFGKEKYGQVMFGMNGGMEHQTMTFMGNFDFDLVAHELAHHWFGDKVTCASWQDIWLNEGFAVYLNTLCYEYLNPPWFKISLSDNQGNAFRVLNGSVWCDDTTTVSRIFSGPLSYSKGAAVLHMLRWELGDSLFFGALRNYLNDTQRAYAFASTADLESHFEAESGRDLSGFFNNWIYGKGYPSYQLVWTQDFSNRVQLTINQTQTDPSVSFYDMPLPILFKNAYSDTTIIFNLRAHRDPGAACRADDGEYSPFPQFRRPAGIQRPI